MPSIGWVLLFFLAVLPALATSGAHGDSKPAFRCHPDQAATLLQLKKSFSLLRYPNSLESWQDGTDCYFWEGVGCSNSSGHVTSLKLSGLYSPGLDPAIFNLTSLQRLDLSMNSFGQYSLPASGFERLSLLTHLNLSNSGLFGQIPIGIGRLASLISLDLSTYYDTIPEDYLYGQFDYVYNSLWLEKPNFQILVANLDNLRELYLDGVSMSNSREDWCDALAKSLPSLQVLSLGSCQLDGPICLSLSTVHSLTVINLQDNFYGSSTPFPEFFMDFLNLSVLNLAQTNLQGWFPRRTFQSKTLRVLDVSWNQYLSGHVPNFSNASSLETMMLEWTNLSFVKPDPFSNFKCLKALSLDAHFVSMEPQSSLGIPRSLQDLKLSQMNSNSDLGPTLSWIGDLENLLSLELSGHGWVFSQTSLSSVDNLKSLRSLSVSGCNFTRPVLFGNLVGLKSLEISYCSFNGPIPSALKKRSNIG
uniref:Uncharacterized protein n=1 Tax=Avena sativa TaxID=4498 RepID=A0ACD5VJA7_AVESA